MNHSESTPEFFDVCPTPPSENMSVDDPTSPPSLSRQSSVVNEYPERLPPIISNYNKWPMTSSEKLVCNYTTKTELTNYHRKLDNVFPLLAADHPKTVQHAFEILKQVVSDAWNVSEGGSELADSICSYLQSSGNLDLLIQYFISGQFGMRLQVGIVLEAYLSNKNVNYILQRGYLREFVRTTIYEVDKKDERHMCLGMSLMESLFRSGEETCKIVVEYGGLNYLLDVCRMQLSKDALLHAAVAISNLALFSSIEVHRLMVQKQVPLWLFMLASNEDKQIEYYSCLSCCILAANKQFERSVRDSDTLQLVVNYLKMTTPDDTAKLDYKYRSGRSKEWLTAFTPLLSSSLAEVQALALYQLCMEASLRKGTDRINGVFQVINELGLMCKIQEIAACPKTDLVAIYAEKLLNVLGEPIPYKLTLAMPLWTCKDVQYWVRKVGFSQYVESFGKHRVDGDLLLRTTEEHLMNEIQMKSAYERMRFIRELNSMKKSANYTSVDSSRLDIWLIRFDPEFSIYTYQMLTKGLERQSLLHVNDAILKEECGMDNSIHRMKLLNTFKEVKHVEEAEVALLRRQIDIFISYRRSTGSQLASLLKVHLQLKGFKVFIDVDRLNWGQFNKSLLLNIKAAKHFILVLTPGALDGCFGDIDCKDWLHLEIKTALESKVNIVPVIDGGFNWPQTHQLPQDIHSLCAFNAIQWVHEYQETCVEKLHKFLYGQQETLTNTTPASL